jgi:hypothetical protein
MAKSLVLKKPSAGARPVPPDAVRVWRGFRLPTLTPSDFLTALGTIFIPVTAQLQSLYGLTAYLPTVLPTGKPTGVPDEIALVFYETQKAYNDTSQIVVGRAYSALHKTVFAFPASLSAFPLLLGPAAATLDQPYYLFKKPVDWQKGFTQVFVGARPASVNVTDFAAGLTKFLQSQQRRPAPGVDGVIACVSSNYVVYWEHWNSEGQSLQGSISDLPNLASRVLLQPYAKQAVDGSLTDHYAGLSQVECKSFNITWKG